MRARHLILGVVVALAMAAVIGTAVASGGATGAATEPSGPVMFSDYFTDPQASAESWSFVNRYGRIADGRLWVDGGYMPNAVPRDGWAVTHVGDSQWKDYAVDVVYSSENVGGGDPSWHGPFIFLRVAAQPEGGLGTTYIVAIQDPGSRSEGGECADYGQPYPTGNVGLNKVVDGVGNWVASTCVSNTTTGTNTVRVTVQGKKIEVVANGQTVMTYTDPTPIKFGGVGVGQIWETNGWFDNVIVRKLG